MFGAIRLKFSRKTAQLQSVYIRINFRKITNLETAQLVQLAGPWTEKIRDVRFTFKVITTKIKTEPRYFQNIKLLKSKVNVDMQDEKSLDGGKPKRQRNKPSGKPKVMESKNKKTTMRSPSTFKSTRTRKRRLMVVKEKLKTVTLTTPLVPTETKRL